MAPKARRPARENVTATTAAPPRPRRGAVSAREFFQRKLGGSLTVAHRETGIGYATLQRHVKHGVPIKHVDIAVRLERWSGGRISAAKTLGV